MKRFLALIFLLVSVCAHAQIDKVVPRKPPAFYAVADYTQTLTEEQKETLNQKLVHYKDSTSTEIAVVIIPTLDGYPEEEVALRILRDWGVGTKDKNNGIVILVAKDDRKIRIEVGYGLEGSVPDITAKTIIDNAIVPAFKEGNYYRGLDKAIDDIIKAAAGEYKAPPGSSKRKKGIGAGAIFFFIILMIILSSIGGRKGGGGGMMSRRGYRDLGAGWILGSILGSGARGGGWSGGGGGGGGFGGFGGGSGGGGGASGSW
jgi:uncharacterized protein